MECIPFHITGATFILADEALSDVLGVTEGKITDAPVGRHVDLTGFRVAPGIVDIHGDGFERHLARRRGAMVDLDAGVLATEAELAANGITTAVLAQFYSWEGGMRGPVFAEDMFTALAAARPHVATDLRAQLRFETHMLDAYDDVVEMIRRHDIGYVVFNDHLPHEQLLKGKMPRGLNGIALRAGRSPEKHLSIIRELHDRRDDVPAAVKTLARRLRDMGILLGSHDDRTAEDRRFWRDLDVRISEFPETAAAADAARYGGDGIIMGAPNMMRGASHRGNVSALDILCEGGGDVLASDYHYPSLGRAASKIAADKGWALDEAWALISRNPAHLLGLHDRGVLTPDMRADLVVLEAATGHVCATFSGGALTYMNAKVAPRFLG